jgi:MFS family permease
MMLAPAIPQIMETFQTAGQGRGLVLFSVTVYLMGQGVGLLFFGPLSDKFGRLLFARTAPLGYTLFTVACALSPTIECLVISRAFAGFFGAVPIIVGGALVADLFPPNNRSVGMTIYAIGPSLGPGLGSIAGSLINGSMGWRWIFWFGTILVSHEHSIQRVLF